MDLIKAHLDKITKKINADSDEELLAIVQSSLATKFTTRYGDLITQLALKAVKTIKINKLDGQSHDEIDIKK